MTNPPNKPAIENMVAHERTVLQPGDYAAFFTALDSPAAPTDKLRPAFARRRQTIGTS